MDVCWGKSPRVIVYLGTNQWRNFCLSIQLCSENNREDCFCFIHDIFVDGQSLCKISRIIDRFLFFLSTQRCWILFGGLLIYCWNTMMMMMMMMMMIKRLLVKHTLECWFYRQSSEDFCMSSCLILQIFIFVHWQLQGDANINAFK